MSTYDDASLIYYPSGVKAGKAYSLKPTDGSGDLDFTRASTATRVNSAGLIESVATGVPRIDYTGAGCAKLLLEPQRTNLVFPSATASTQTRTTTAQSYTLSFYGTGTVVRSGTSTGTLVGTGANDRVFVTFTATAGSLTLTITGSVTNWQLESGSYPTSYIPTTTTAVTRVKDETSTTIIPTMTGVSEFTWFFDNTDMDVLEAVVVYMQLNLSGGPLRYYATNGGRFRGSTYFGDVPAKGKVAVKCDGTTLSMFKNGVKSASTLASALGTFVNFSGFNQGGETFSGGMQSMILFPTALSDDEIIALTTI